MSHNNSRSTRKRSSILPAPESTRLVTIVAHVDHGKTTLADSLVEHNGIISERSAGTIRYLDSMEEERRRGITIRSSAIGLRHVYQAPPGGGGGIVSGGGKKKGKIEGKGSSNSSSGREMVIHLIDSPGHVDFSQEVSTSLHLCDGALLMVDVVEGMCARTHSILRESYRRRLIPVLVLNKVDRLCTDLGLTVEEGWQRLRNTVESVNAVASGMVRRECVEHEDSQREEELERIWTFEPCAGNVVFASALYGWGFTVPCLARSLYRAKVIPNVKPPVLRQFLFAECRYDRKTGKVIKWKERVGGGDGEEGERMTMFAEFGLKPLWDIVMGVYTAATSLGMTSELFSEGRSFLGNSSSGDGSGSGSGNAAAQDNAKSKRDGIKMKATTSGMEDLVLSALEIGSTTALASNVPQQLLPPSDRESLQLLLDRTNASSETHVLRALLRRHRPVSHAVMDAVCDRCPDPREAAGGARSDILRLAEPSLTTETDKDGGGGDAGGGDVETRKREFDSIQEGVQKCRIEGQHDGAESGVATVAHVCKFVATDRTHISDPELIALLDGTEAENGHREVKSTILLGVARVLSGTLHSTDVHYYCFGPKHRHSSSSAPPRKALRLYLLMGSSYLRVSSVPAGHICAVYGLEHLHLKTVTLCSREEGMPVVQEADIGAGRMRPLIKVNVEAVSSSDTNILERGLAKLSLADAAIEVTATARGERILACQGEIHLEQSILDLETVHCAEKIALRISKPIVDFGEGTDWFDAIDATAGAAGICREVGDYVQFYDNGPQSNLPPPSPLRQLGIPPYCYEDGLPGASRGRSRVIGGGRCVAVSVRVVPLSTVIYNRLRGREDEGNDSQESLKEDTLALGRALGFTFGDGLPSLSEEDAVLSRLQELLCSIDTKGNAMIESAGVRNETCVKGVISGNGEVYVPPPLSPTKKTFTPTTGKAGGNITDEVKEANDDSVVTPGKQEYDALRECIRNVGLEATVTTKHGNDSQVNNIACKIWKSEMHASAIAGFHSTCAHGPLCEEPIRGILLVLEGVEIALVKNDTTSQAVRQTTSNDSNIDNKTAPTQTPPLTTYQMPRSIGGGMIITTLRTSIRSALLTRPSRLIENHLRLTLHSSLSALGPLHSTLSRRRGRVVEDSMVDGTDLLAITATLPQIESFGLSTELLERSSGEVTAPELIFSHWERLEEDPFWIPTSLEEREDYGEIKGCGDTSTGVGNNALKYIRMVRERKGLMVDSKIIVEAEKQRTLARKK